MSKSIIKQMIEEGKFTKEDVMEFAKLGYSQIENGMLIKFDERDLDKNGNYTVPEGVNVIDGYAFSDVKANIINLGNVTHIRENAFWNNNIQHIVLPNTLKFVEKWAFHLSWEITSIKLPNSLEEIPANAFDNCLKLKTVKLPKNLKVIGKCAFARCEELTNIVLPNSVEKIEDGAFSRCVSLKSLNRPKNLRWLGQKVFFESPMSSIRFTSIKSEYVK